ncbi:MAG: right-handed parallel beta-helix repeat-containing protein [Phycisphaerales bacterium JB039]
MTRACVTVLMCLWTAVAAAQTTYYVDGDCGDDAWSGTSAVCAAPDGPKRSIGAAVKIAAAGDEVIVADGVYTGPNNLDIDFAGRDLTVRSAGGPDGCVIDCEGISRAFVLRSGETRDAVIEGFTIRRGAAPGGVDLRGGGIGILSPSFGTPAPSPTIRNCVFEGCDTGIYNGGAILIQEQSEALIERCVFRSNRSGGGGAVQCEGNFAEFIDCQFIDNEAGVGGAILLTGGSQLFVNCLFQGNAGSSPGGGAIFGNSGCTPTIVNSTFTGNSGTGGAWYSNRGSVATITGSIMWGNTPDQIFVEPFGGADPVVTYSDIEGGWTGTGNIDADPMFVDAGAGDLRLAEGSPCADAGDNTALPAGVLTDLDGLDRFVDDPLAPETGVSGGAGGESIVDMGAYERQAGGCYADCDGSGSLDFFDFLCFQNLFGVGDPAADCDGSGALDFFDFLCFQNAFAAGCP